ncbi:hypothetical protein [Streptomyces sp. KL116D]|uniref:hypothetical protein n=1 Tax=Streptomyces sp. KL116D TaxID=3045152 RepID=UPI0035588602
MAGAADALAHVAAHLAEADESKLHVSSLYLVDLAWITSWITSWIWGTSGGTAAQRAVRGDECLGRLVQARDVGAFGEGGFDALGEDLAEPRRPTGRSESMFQTAPWTNTLCS